MKTFRTVLIAGAGDVGMRLAELRAARGDDVVALRRRAVADAGGVRNLRADLVTGDGFARLPRQPDALVFCAAPDQRNEAAYRSLYIGGLRRLLDRLQVPRLVFVSSTAVYAQDAGEWVDEATPARAEACNGRVLLEAEHEIETHPANVILRLSGIYGPGRESMLRRAREGSANSLRWSNRIHAGDAAAALSQLLDEAKPQALYLGSDNLPVLECELQDWLRRREGLPPVMPDGSRQSGRRVANSRLRATGWTPSYPDYRAGYAELSGPGPV